MLVVSLKRLPSQFAIVIPLGDRRLDRLLGEIESELCHRGFLVSRQRPDKEAGIQRTIFQRFFPPAE